MRKVKKKLTVDDIKKAADSGNQSFEHWLKTGKLPVKKQIREVGQPLGVD